MGHLGQPKDFVTKKATNVARITMLLKSNRMWSGRQDSNLRRTAWKADTLPLSYARFKRCSATLGGNYTASSISLYTNTITHSLHPLPNRVRSRIASGL